MKCYVFFDVDDTLVEWRVRWQDAFVQAAAAAGVAATWELASDKLTEALDTYYHDYVVAHCQAGRADDREFWLEYDGRILTAMGVPGDPKSYAEKVWEMLQSPDAITLYHEVPEVLQELSARGARLGIITGRPAAKPDLTRLGIGHYFDPVLDAFGTGTTKRETWMFELAAEAAARARAPRMARR